MAPNLLSLARDLQRRKARRRRRLAAAEGVRLVADALASGVTIRGALVTPDFERASHHAPLLAALAAHAIRVELIPAREMLQLADTETPQGILGILELPVWTTDAIRPERGRPALVLDAVQDPGNVGALLRTAFGLGAAGAILLKGTADLANPKVLRGAMGATLRLPCVPTTDDEFAAWARQLDIEVIAAAADGTPVSRADVRDRVALVVGNEAAGVREVIRGLCRRTVAVPLARGAESLNVAVAAGILLYELQRARP